MRGGPVLAFHDPLQGRSIKLLWDSPQIRTLVFCLLLYYPVRIQALQVSNMTNSFTTFISSSQFLFHLCVIKIDLKYL